MLEPEAVTPRHRLRAYAFLAAVAGLVVALDQWAKYAVRTELGVGESWSALSWLEPYARIIHWSNTGAAFGLLPSAGLVFTVVAVGVSAAIIYYFPRLSETQVVMRLALALQLGGALGNLVDRILIGTVTDFISVSSFPVFNVADASITVGTALLLAAMWVEDRQRKREAAQPGQDAHAGGNEVGGA